MVSPDDIRFLAGVIDARGHIEINERHGHPQPRVRVTTKRWQLLQWCADLTGTRVIQDSRGYRKKLCAEHCQHQHAHVVRQSAQWTVDSGRATIVLYAVQPFVVCQVDEVRAALFAGLTYYPPARGDTIRQMAAMGWPVPSLEMRVR